MSIIIAIGCLVVSVILWIGGATVAAVFGPKSPLAGVAGVGFSIVGLVGAWVSGTATFITIVVAILRLLGVLS